MRKDSGNSRLSDAGSSSSKTKKVNKTSNTAEILANATSQSVGGLNQSAIFNKTSLMNSKVIDEAITE